MLRERIPLVTVILLLENLESVKVCWHVIIWWKLLLLSTFSIILIFWNTAFWEWEGILSHWTVIESGSFHQMHLNGCLPTLSPEDGQRSVSTHFGFFCVCEMADKLINVVTLSSGLGVVLSLVFYFWIEFIVPLYLVVMFWDVVKWRWGSVAAQREIRTKKRLM